MCGIAGILDLGASASREALEAAARRMGDALRHRGPDAEGQWADPEAGVALAHRRLSIIDLSQAGAQPMASASGRFVMVYNGEVYTFPELRAELEQAGARFRGDSDTEVMLAAFEAWGLEASLQRMAGMFAFALWDAHERALYLVRDRAGEKPLYYGRFGRVLLFGSELKALRRHEAFRGEVSPQALACFLRRGYVPGAMSIYQGVHKLPPGCLLRIPAREAPLPAPKPYWSMAEAAARGARTPFEGSEDEAAAELERLLLQAVSGQMLADVPLGAFLSGGVDSSAIVALMQAVSSRPVKTFTVGFWEKEFNEAGHAREVAAHLGTEHTEMFVTAEDALNVVPRLPQIYDEPFADFSQIPTHLIAALARQYVTVSLSADAGDEFFLGYNSYFWVHGLWQRLGWIPGPLRRGFGVLGLLSPRLGNALGRAVGLPMLGHRLALLGGLLPLPSPEALSAELLAHWKRPEQVLGERFAAVCPAGEPAPPELTHHLQRMQFADAVGYLPDDILVKVDRAAMAVSLETRAPLLDHRIMEFSWRVPLAMKLRQQQGRLEGKKLLRRVLYKYVPRELIERPKMGFSVPMAQWLRGPLRQWAEGLLEESRLLREGFFRPEAVRRVWDEHQAGVRDWKFLLWDLLQFQAWLEAQGGEG